MNASATSAAEIDFTYVMKRYERAYVRIFGTKLAAEIKEAEAFGARARTLDALYANLQFSDFADGYTAMGSISTERDVQAYSRVRTSTLGIAYATAQLDDADAELDGWGPTPFALEIERRLGVKVAQINANRWDRTLWYLYCIFIKPQRLENARRQHFFLTGLQQLADSLPPQELERWVGAGWPTLRGTSLELLRDNTLQDLLTRKAWVQL